MTLWLVPASEPRMPLFDRAAKAAVVDSIERPDVLAWAATWANAKPISCTDAVDAFAAPARADDTRTESLAPKLKPPKPLTMYPAASPSSRPPAVARVSVSWSAPPAIWAWFMPPLASSNMASDAPLALNDVLVPMSIAKSRSFDMSWPDAPRVAPVVRIVLSKSPAALMAPPRPPTSVFAPLYKTAKPITRRVALLNSDENRSPD